VNCDALAMPALSPLRVEAACWFLAIATGKPLDPRAGRFQSAPLSAAERKTDKDGQPLFAAK